MGCPPNDQEAHLVIATFQISSVALGETVFTNLASFRKLLGIYVVRIFIRIVIVTHSTDGLIIFHFSFIAFCILKNAKCRKVGNSSKLFNTMLCSVLLSPCNRHLAYVSKHCDIKINCVEQQFYKKLLNQIIM